jgi:putative ABC transport system ATP-binding protein
MISATELSYRYPAGRQLFYPSFSLEKGKSLLIIGKSGCGKSTLLHMLGGLLRPQTGSISIHNQNIAHISDNELDRFRGKHIGFVFQRSYFVQSLTVKDNIFLAPFLAHKKADNRKFKELTEALGIDRLLKKFPATLSQGEQQRVTIARALINEPDLILADEPTSSLDDDNTEAVAGLLTRLAVENNAALIIVTHDERLKKLIPKQLVLP